jgi:hypothetical protein
MRYFILTVACTLSSVAYALDVHSTVEQGWVVVSATLPHSKEQVDSFLSGSAKTMKLGDGVREVRTESLDNGCTKMHVTNNGFAKTLSYTSMRCPIPGGWHSKMVSSEDFEEHDIQWVAIPDGANTSLSIRVKVSLKAPIPDFVVRSIVTKGLTQTLERLDAKLASADLAPSSD